MPQAFSYGGYFVSEEAEKAAKWQLVENYNSAKAKLAALDGQLKQAGTTFLDMGRVVKDIHSGIVFKFGKDQITVVNESHSYGQAQTVAEIGLKFLNAESLITLLKDFQDTRRTVEELRANLKNVGLDL